MKNTAFLDFVKYSLSSEMLQPPLSVRIDWMQFFNFCYRQGIIGIVFYGFKKSNLKIDIYCLSEWVASAERIKKQNNVVKKLILKLTKFFHVQGIRSCILKGQGMARMYMPHSNFSRKMKEYWNLGVRRLSGDIDAWLEGGHERAFLFAK